MNPYKLLVSLSIILLPFLGTAQKSLDTRIIVTVPDTSGLYEKTRMAFVDEGMIVVDNRRTDTISTHPFNIKSTTYLLTYAAISGSTVTIWGYLADANTNMMGITVNPSKKEYQKIFYYPGDKYWKKLKKIAERIGGTLSYDNEK